MARVIEQSGGYIMVAITYDTTETSILGHDYLVSMTTSEAYELYTALAELDLTK